jgi:molybdenum cofactor cytidylyltransferase
MNLRHALRLKAETRLALSGAGGKSSALFQISRQYKPPVLVTATTHLAVYQAALADRHFILETKQDIYQLETGLPEMVLLFTGPQEGADRFKGLAPGTLEAVRALAEAHRVPLLIEADGSRQLPVKAPAAHEPAIPRFVDQVVVVAGLSALGKRLSPEWVHRPERFAALSGLIAGDEITPAGLSNVLVHPSGGLKGVPDSARRVILLNQADTPALQAKAHGMAAALRQAYQAVVIAALQPPGFGAIGQPPGATPAGIETGGVLAVHERIAGIILAAGAAQRFGSPKQLLPWRGEPMVRHVARKALAAGLAPVVVVLGAHADQIEGVLNDLAVERVVNPEWEQGQSTSLQAGLKALPPGTGGAMFMLADQPQITPGLLQALLEAHRVQLPPIAAPLIDGRRGNPVLFDATTFADLMGVQGDTGGRALFSRYPIAWVPWHDASALLDIDTPEDYTRLLDHE